MSRTVSDLALFLDTMAGLDLQDPMTFDAPHVSFSDAVARPVAPKRVAFTADYNGKMAIDRELREICTKAARRFEELGCIVEEASPDIGAIDEAFLNLRSQAFVVDRELPAETLLRAARSVDRTLVAEIRLFDVYEGAGLPDGKKSLAITVVLQPQERTLTDTEIEGFSKRLIAQVEKATGGQLRG